MKIGFIGTGRMGFPMALHLAKTSNELVVWNRTVEKARPLAEYGARIANSVKEVAENSEIIFLMVSDDEASRSILREIFSRAATQVIVNHSTVSPLHTHEAYVSARALGIEYLAIPVMGNPASVERGECLCIVGGSGNAFSRVSSLTGKYCKEHVYVGEPERASVIKLALNTMYFMALESLAEALLLVKSWNVEEKEFLDIASKLWLKAIVDRYAQRLLDDSIQTSFQLGLAAKDLFYAVLSGFHKGQPLPVTSRLAETFLEASQIGKIGDKDYTKIYKFLKCK
jgi:3-hydroxyisobutyrate dehydrogenase